MLKIPAYSGTTKNVNSPKNLFLSVVVLIIIVLLVVPDVYSQSYGKVSYEIPAEDEDRILRPYLIGHFGTGQPSDAAYDQVFDATLFKAGGGFGMRYRGLGVEVLIRRGGVEKTRRIEDSPTETTYRRFYYSSTEIMLRLYGSPKIKRLRFPVGIGIGLANTTVDRGYSGEYDRFTGSGFFIGPFAGVEYKINSTMSLSLEAEYSISESNFNENRVWYNQHGIDPPGQLQSTESNFWDTVGGLSDESFDGGGLKVSLKVSIFIPTFKSEEK